jgi:hypothetical protein
MLYTFFVRAPMDVSSEHGVKRKAPDDAGDAGADAFACSICSELNTEPVSLSCGHTLCAQCIVALFARRALASSTVPCPECRAAVHEKHVFEVGASFNARVDYTRAVVNKLAQAAVRAAVGAAVFDAAVAQRRAEREQQARAHADAVHAVIVGALNGAAADAAVLTHSRAQRLTGERYLQRVLAGHVREGTLGCSREWTYYQYPPPAVVSAPLDERTDAVYYLNERFDAAALSVLRTFTLEGGGAGGGSAGEAWTGAAALLLVHLQRMALAPDRYKTTLAQVLEWMRTIGAFISTLFTVSLLPSTLRILDAKSRDAAAAEDDGSDDEHWRF